MIHYTRVVNGLAHFVDQDMVQKMNGSWKAWAVGTVTALAIRKAPDIMESLRGNKIVQAMGLIDGEMIDVDTIYAALLEQAQKRSATVDIPVIGSVTYSASDVEQLYRCIVG